ncbi:ROK family transcriptional regulator [Streptomyces spinoverrucosus]|uniref:ROK family transcriptional regulator n=1 Tax=Streptomyces spinoverrucosus TaxID=284043 RepID=UPI0018C4326B|nr:ROK family transcriptional regulator [Streptomyces spinoverrucosus]MBG0856781.1 ROK family transcriptional regulator [Streptomyces spinoverrucosus]
MPASPSTARAINDRLALRLLQQEGPLTAGQLKQLTGLSRPTVADLVERLSVSGLIAVVGEAGEQRRGPNAKLYGIVADRAYLAALDVRTEGVSVIVSDLLGRVLAEASVPIGDDTGTGPAVEQAVALVERAAKEAGAMGAPPREDVRAWGRLHTVGIGAPGLIDPATGELRDSSGLPAWHRRLVAVLQERLPDARVTVENETNLAALAEQREGAARDRDTFVLLWLGQGTGAAVVLDGALRRGASGGTGEIGFLPVPGTGGLPSATDCAGGFHSLAAAGAIVGLAGEYGVGADDGGGLGAAELVRGATDRVAGSVGGAAGGVAGSVGGATGGVAGSVGGATGGVAGSVGGATGGVAGSVGGATGGVAGSVGGATGGVAGSVGGATDRVAGSVRGAAGGVAESVRGAADSAESGESAARFLDALADRLAIGVASVAAVLDPGCVVLGGEIGQAGGEVLAGLVEERVRRMSPLVTEVRASVLGGGAVLRGALLTAQDRAQDELFAPPGPWGR